MGDVLIEDNSDVQLQFGSFMEMGEEFEVQEGATMILQNETCKG